MAPKNNSFIVGILIKHIKSFKNLYKSFNFSHSQQKYDLSDYLIEILFVLKTGIAWAFGPRRDIRSKINWSAPAGATLLRGEFYLQNLHQT